MRDLCDGHEVNMDGKTVVLNGIKLLNGIDQGGIKRLQKFEDAMTGAKEDRCALAVTLKDATDKRAAARLLISLRTAAIILEKGLADSVQGLYNECKLLKVTIPKPVKTMLDALQARGDGEV